MTSEAGKKADRELLELAARAAGINAVARCAFGDSEVIEECRLGLWNRESGGIWNPLTDDGDALRLAVKLNIDVLAASGSMEDVGCVFPAGGDFGEVCEPARPDQYAATRRAIVRAAALASAEPAPDLTRALAQKLETR